MVSVVLQSNFAIVPLLCWTHCTASNGGSLSPGDFDWNSPNTAASVHHKVDVVPALACLHLPVSGGSDISTFPVGHLATGDWNVGNDTKPCQVTPAPVQHGAGSCDNVPGQVAPVQNDVY